MNYNPARDRDGWLPAGQRRRTIYDLETFPNAFTGCFKPVDAPTGVFFEISERRRDNDALWTYLHSLEEMVGFNNMGFDWPVLATFLNNPNCGAWELYCKAQEIINSYDRFTHVIWKPAVPQIDLYKIHHFDNRARSTSLKAIEFAGRSRSVMDLPFEPGSYLSSAEIDTLLHYNAHDVLETEKFYHASREKIAFRETLPPDWMNYSDGKIGKQFFIRELEGHGVECFARDSSGKRTPRQTPRPNGVPLTMVLLPYLHFARPELVALLADLKGQTIYDTKGDFARKFDLAGVPCVMGCGGMHGSVERRFFDGRGEREILDLDVTSFYPQISIQNTIFPEHLGPLFCVVYEKLFQWRQTTQKGDSNNKALKLALNVPFGESNSEFGPFLDPAYMLAITMNGQLLVLSLAERLLCVEGIELVQINTDGVTVSYPRERADEVREIYAAWSAATRMPLETATYSRMWIRDVNNYVAEFTDTEKGLKRKGAYEFKRDWHQDHSMLVIRKAVVEHMTTGRDLEEIIRAHPDPFDFMMRIKVGRGSYVRFEDGQVLSGVIRYYLGEVGRSATKHMPSSTQRLHAGGHAHLTGHRGAYGCSECGWTGKTKKAHLEHSQATHASKLVVCNIFEGGEIRPDIRFYLAEARKLVISEGPAPAELEGAA